MSLRLMRLRLRFKRVYHLVRFILLAGLTAITIYACASNTSHLPSNNKIANSATSGAAARVVKHAMGETKVPAQPQRVVVLDTAPRDAALALGVRPIGSSLPRTDSFPAYLGDRTAGITPVGKTQPNLESIVRLQPDLILGNMATHKQIYDKLSQIAPTVLTSGNSTGGCYGVECLRWTQAPHSRFVTGYSTDEFG